MKGEECLSPDRDEGREDISCSSYQNFLVRQTGKCWFMVLGTLSPSFYVDPMLSLPFLVQPGIQSTSADTEVQTLPVGSRSPFMPPPHPQGSYCQIKRIVVSISIQKGGKSCGLKAQGKETGILYRLLNVQFKTWWIGRWKAPAEKWIEKLHFGLGETCAYNIKDVQINK